MKTKNYTRRRNSGLSGTMGKSSGQYSRAELFGTPCYAIEQVRDRDRAIEYVANRRELRIAELVRQVFDAGTDWEAVRLHLDAGMSLDAAKIRVTKHADPFA